MHVGAVPGLKYASIALSTATFSAAAADVAITATLVITLRKRVMDFNAATDSMVRALIRLAFVSASYTAVFAFAGAVLKRAWSYKTFNANSSWAFVCKSPSPSCPALDTTSPRC